MFTNIGGKIKTFAKVICWVGIIAAVFSGITAIVGGLASGANSTALTVVTGVLTMIIGALAAWIGSFITYGFGEIVENVQKIADKK